MERSRGVAARFTNEGAVQAMLCARAATLFGVIDREAVIGFSNTAEKEATYARRRGPLHAASRPEGGNKWIVPKPFGGELDLLAVDPAGRLLAIEIKPGSFDDGCDLGAASDPDASALLPPPVRPELPPRS